MGSSVTGVRKLYTCTMLREPHCPRSTMEPVWCALSRMLTTAVVKLHSVASAAGEGAGDAAAFGDDFPLCPPGDLAPAGDGACFASPDAESCGGRLQLMSSKASNSTVAGKYLFLSMRVKRRTE